MCYVHYMYSSLVLVSTLVLIILRYFQYVLLLYSNIMANLLTGTPLKDMMFFDKYCFGVLQLLLMGILLPRWSLD